MNPRKKSLIIWAVVSLVYIVNPFDFPGIIDDAAVTAVATLIEGIHQLMLCFPRTTKT